MERLTPGTSLVRMVLDGKDEEATDILGNVIERMSARESQLSGPEPSKAFVTVQDWARGFERYLAKGDDQIPEELVQAAHEMYSDLCSSQRETRLLHGDLHHYNVLFDSTRGWLSTDPKGVIGELEYELGAVLRNPIERPDLFLIPSVIERRLTQLTSRLHLNLDRAVGWGFSQAVLSAIWDIEDGFRVDAAHTSLRLATAVRPMVGPI
jgi:streptomycin 6-kinase